MLKPGRCCKLLCRSWMALGCKVNCLQSTASGSTVTHPLLPLPGTLILCRCLLQHGHNPRHQNVAGEQHVSLCCSLARPSTWYAQMLILILAIGNQSIASPLVGGSSNGNVQQGTAVYGFLQRASTLQQKGDEGLKCPPSAALQGACTATWKVKQPSCVCARLMQRTAVTHSPSTFSFSTVSGWPATIITAPNTFDSLSSRCLRRFTSRPSALQRHATPAEMSGLHCWQIYTAVFVSACDLAHQCSFDRQGISCAKPKFQVLLLAPATWKYRK